ncbi:MAG: DUF4331 family protein, partial [Vulcanimicrobiaceae bacterium]
MKVTRLLRILGTAFALCAIAVAGVLYNAHTVRSSDHQDSPTVTAHPRADITDVYVFPAPANPANVVFVMNVDPLLTPTMTPGEILDPNVMYQFKIAHGATSPEDQVIQVAASGTTPATQQITLYGPAKPNSVGTDSTFVASSGTFAFTPAGGSAAGTTLADGIKAFVGPRADPFFFDLFQFFTILPDRNFKNARTGNTLGTATPTFNGFAAGTMSSTNAGAYACGTTPSSNALEQAAPPGFNVISIVLEIPK